MKSLQAKDYVIGREKPPNKDSRESWRCSFHFLCEIVFTTPDQKRQVLVYLQFWVDFLRF